ncbi:MAG: hypothetical protein ACFFCS_22235 [Candidatus Hodarchaeota archaeon]
MRERKRKHDFPITRETARLNVLANLFPILVDTFGSEKAKKNLSKIEGKEIVAHIPALNNGSITFKPYGNQINTTIGDSENAVGRVWFNVEFDEIMEALSTVIRAPNNIAGLLKLLFKFIIPGKIKIKGFGPVIKIFLCFMVGKNPMYKEKSNIFAENPEKEVMG